MYEFTGPIGSIFVRTEKIEAIIADGNDGCRILVSGQWLIISETAEEVLSAMGED